MKNICYTLDLEEDHAGLLKNYYEGLDYLDELIEITTENEIKISFFVQAKLIEKFPEKIELLRNKNFEIHLHSYSHQIKLPIDIDFESKEISKSKEIYQRFFNTSPVGYRFPLGVIERDAYKILNKSGFKFDSSIFPTIRLGHFNNLRKPLKPYFVDGIVEIPFSVISKTVRIPIALSYMKLFYPLHFINNYDFSPIIFDFHMHDLFNLSSTQKLPILKRFIYLRKKDNGLGLFLKFHEKLVNRGYETVKISKIFEDFNNGKL